MMLPPSFTNIRADLDSVTLRLESANARLDLIENEFNAVCRRFNNYASNARLALKAASTKERYHAAFRLVADLAKENENYNDN